MPIAEPLPLREKQLHRRLSLSRALHPQHTRLGVALAYCRVHRAVKNRVAVALYGLFRNLPATQSSLEANLFAVLRHTVGFDTFVHSMQPRGGAEAGTPVDTLAALKIDACRIALANQTAVDEHFELLQLAHRDFGARPLRFTREGRIHFHVGDLLNVRRALYSLQAAEALITLHERRSAFNYTAILVARPDTAIASPVPFVPPPALLESEAGGGILVPNFDHWGGVNDRFAFGDRRSMRVYMQRFDVMRAKVLTAFNSERLLCDVLREARIPVGVVPLCVVRVRANGGIVAHDHLVRRAALPAHGCLRPQQVVRRPDDLVNPCPRPQRSPR